MLSPFFPLLSAWRWPPVPRSNPRTSSVFSATSRPINNLKCLPAEALPTLGARRLPFNWQEFLFQHGRSCCMPLACTACGSLAGVLSFPEVFPWALNTEEVNRFPDANIYIWMIVSSWALLWQMKTVSVWFHVATATQSGWFFSCHHPSSTKLSFVIFFFFYKFESDHKGPFEEEQVCQCFRVGCGDCFCFPFCNKKKEKLGD